MPPLSPFTRYYDIIDDVPAFEKTLHSRSQRSIWTNRLRITPNKLVKFLENDGHLCKPLPWSHQAFRLSNGGAGLGRHWSYAAGLFNIQEASAMLPAIVLDPQPGERVLDLCAAPG